MKTCGTLGLYDDPVHRNEVISVHVEGGFRIRNDDCVSLFYRYAQAVVTPVALEPVIMVIVFFQIADIADLYHSLSCVILVLSHYDGFIRQK